MIDCRLLDLARELSAGSRFPLRELLAVLLGVFRSGYGRVYVSRKTGIPERRVRSIYEYIAGLKQAMPGLYVEVAEGFSEVKILAAQAGEYYATVFTPVSPSLLKAVESRIVELRDWIIVEAGDRGCIEVIGLSTGRPVFPRVPEELQDKYLEILPEEILVDNSLIVLWRKYTPILSESIVLSALASLCREL
ncbi:MAG: hypothetical protein OWQ48_02445 [Desulfurococcus sp.]|nr:hypothetical protein [Desulfurococcus sp.]